MFLTPAELQELTGYSWIAKQRWALIEMGIRFRTNPRGRILVDRACVEHAERSAPARRRQAPDWAAMGKAQ